MAKDKNQLEVTNLEPMETVTRATHEAALTDAFNRLDAAQTIIGNLNAQLAQKFGAAKVAELKTAMRAYPGFRGTKSCKMLEVTVPILSVGCNVVASIYANFEPSTDGHTITFGASVPKNVFFNDDVAREEFLAHAEIAAVTHPGYADIRRRAELALTTGSALSGKRPDMNAGIVPNMAPRLVDNRATA